MGSWRILTISLVLAFSVAAGICNAAPSLNRVSPATVVAGGQVALEGSNFVVEKDLIKVDVGGQTVFIKPDPSLSTGSKLVFTVPSGIIGSELSVSVIDTAGGASLIQKITIYRDIIKEAIIWKNAGMPETSILEHLSGLIQKDVECKELGGSPDCSKTGVDKFSYFDGVTIIDEELTTLKNAKFTDDFIAELEGQEQFVTLGLSAVYFDKTKEFATAPMLRIFLIPRSYFKPRYSFLTTNFMSKKWWIGVKEAIDLNVGYTLSSTESGDSQSGVHYLLAGISYEMNRAAFLNLGQAIPVNNDTAAEKTWYLGITVDHNFFKVLGLMK